MSKRFTETTKWADPWYRGLTPKLKSFWQYCLDNCDHAGVWPVDFDLASFCIGEKVTKKEVLESFSTRVVFFGSDKMLVVKFISFQYGTLSPDCKMHRPVFASLSKNRLNYDNLKGIDTLSIGFDTLQDKNKDQDKDQDQEKDSETKKTEEPPPGFYSDPIFQNPEFREAWDGWVEARRKARKTPTERAMRLNLAQLREIAPSSIEKAIKILNTATMRGWTGLFDPDENKFKPKEPAFHGYSEPME